MKLLSRFLAVALAAFAFAADARTIVIGHVDLSYHEATAAVYKTVLERSGYNVAIRKGPRSILLPMLAEGELDLFVAAWLPDIDAGEWEQYKDKLVQITPLYSNAKLFWAVPDYIPESAVASVADLAKADVAARMHKVILGPDAERELMARSDMLMNEYRLADAGYELKSAKTDAWTGSFSSNIESKSWFVVPLWQPQYLNATAKLRILQEPKGILGKPHTAWLAGNKRTESKIEPHIFAIVKRMEFSVAWITELDRMVNVEQYPPDVAARIWMAAHPYTVEYWIDKE